jgi:hypothetical protein
LIAKELVPRRMKYTAETTACRGPLYATHLQFNRWARPISQFLNVRLVLLDLIEHTKHGLIDEAILLW